MIAACCVYRSYRGCLFFNMEFVFIIILGLVLMQNYTPCTNAAPQTPTEACPPDSVLSGDECKCIPDKCPEKPPCPWTLELVVNDTATASECCPSYKCIGCPESQELDNGECPCAPGARMDENGKKCVCEEEEKHLVNGECVCNPTRCELPPLCDKKSVAVTSQEGCCKKTICKQCPFDSESTNLDPGLIDMEDHCVCLPCEKHCGVNETVVIKKKGTGFPGNCCDLYECQKPEVNTNGECIEGDVLHKDGDEWETSDSQCKCNSGLTLCSQSKDMAQNCYVDNKVYAHLENWTNEDGCMLCTCRNGLEHCVSHFCFSKETKVHKKNETQSCIKDGQTHLHEEVWLEKDGCTNCTCLNGKEHCANDLCETILDKISECQPLDYCNKTCLNGYKVNRKGCEICKCNIIKLGQDILVKYNITMVDLIAILEDYKKKRNSITTTTSTTNTPTSTTSTSSTTAPPNIEIMKQADPVVIALAQNAKLDVLLLTTTTTEPSVVPTENVSDPWIYITIVVIAFAFVFIGMAIMCVYRSKRKSSIDLTQCQYESVNNHNNNNTIKKTDQLL